jgi:protein-S-isoprenylcysteine O-methyltransferase Ste14
MEMPSADRPGVIAFPPGLFAGTFLVGLLVQWLIPRHLWSSTVVRPVGGGLLILGIALASWGRATMRRGGTNIDPREPALAIVTDGPFRFSRNPLYVAITLFYLGLTLLANALWPLLLLLPLLLVTHYGIVLREERYLEKKFGQTYLNYRRQVRRWV